MLKTIVTPQNTDYVLTLPNEYLNRPIEILVFPLDIMDDDQASAQPLRLALSEPDRRAEPVSADQADGDQEFWDTFGSWRDDRSAEAIIADIYAARTTTERTTRL